MTKASEGVQFPSFPSERMSESPARPQAYCASTIVLPD